MFLFFDTETNGKPKTWQAKMHDLNNWPRVAQLAWHVYDKDGFCSYKKEHLIYPQGWEIPKEKFFIDNGMATERNEKFGVMISTVLKEFIDDMQSCEYIIAHNMAFDYNVLGAEMIRQSLRSEKKLKQICTMAETTAFCELPAEWEILNIQNWRNCTGFCLMKNWITHMMLMMMLGILQGVFLNA